MTQKQISDDTLAGQELYDSVMAHIEPDLLSANIDTIDEKYADESDVDRAAREEGYQNAFDECVRVLSLMKEGLVDQAHRYAQMQKATVSKKEAEEKEQNVEQAEAELDSLDS